MEEDANKISLLQRDMYLKNGHYYYKEPNILKVYSYYAMDETSHNLKETIEKIKLTDDGKLEITIRFVIPSNKVYLTYPSRPVPDKVLIFKEIFVAKEGKIILEKRIQAKYTPPKTEEIPEKIEWKD